MDKNNIIHTLPLIKKPISQITKEICSKKQIKDTKIKKERMYKIEDKKLKEELNKEIWDE